MTPNSTEQPFGPETHAPLAHNEGIANLAKINQLSESFDYKGSPNRSIYELIMRLSNGRPNLNQIRLVINTAHDMELLSDQFSSSQLSIFRDIGDNAVTSREHQADLEATPLWKLVIQRAEQFEEDANTFGAENPYGDPETLWRDLANLYGFSLDTTFSSIDSTIRGETNENEALAPDEQFYTAPVWASHDMLSDEQRPNGVVGFGKGATDNAGW